MAEVLALQLRTRRLVQPGGVLRPDEEDELVRIELQRPLGGSEGLERLHPIVVSVEVEAGVAVD
jgi:hypothetical protein